MFKTIVPVILIMVSAIVGYFYVLPAYSVTSSVKKEVKVVEKSLQNIKEISIASNRLRLEIESIPREYKDSLKAALPEDVDEIRFLNMLNSIASRRNIILISPEVSIEEQGSLSNDMVNNKVNNGDVGKINASFSVSSSYEVFKEFMKDLERSLLLMDINTIALSSTSSNEEDAEELYTYKVELTTYLFNSK